jgi:hypothetical protein
MRELSLFEPDSEAANSGNGLARGSPRELAASPKRCTMAIWHRPLITSAAKPAGAQVPG